MEKFIFSIPRVKSSPRFLFQILHPRRAGTSTTCCSPPSSQWRLVHEQALSCFIAHAYDASLAAVAVLAIGPVSHLFFSGIHQAYILLVNAGPARPRARSESTSLPAAMPSRRHPRRAQCREKRAYERPRRRESLGRVAQDKHDAVRFSGQLHSRARSSCSLRYPRDSRQRSRR